MRAQPNTPPNDSDETQPVEGVDAYCGLAAADIWFSARGQAGWADASRQERVGALIRAAEWLDGHFRFRGEPVAADQPRAWPRRGIGANAGVVGLPAPVRQAYFELALALVDGDEAGEALLGVRGAVTGEQIGGVSLRYAQSRRGTRLDALLAPFLVSSATTRIERT